MPDTIHILGVRPDGPGRYAWVIKVNGRRTISGHAKTEDAALAAARLKAVQLRLAKAERKQ
mgnify:CR=1 FL=1